MKKINFDILLLTSVMCLIPILFGLYFYQELPDIVAVHFDINNNPNVFMLHGHVHLSYNYAAKRQNMHGDTKIINAYEKAARKPDVKKPNQQFSGRYKRKN